jgi:hypothetical protein
MPEQPACCAWQLTNDIEIVISEPIIAEVIGVLREKFDWQGYLFVVKTSSSHRINNLGARRNIVTTSNLP